MRKVSLLIGLAIVLSFTDSHAYIGPGVAAGTIAVVFGTLLSIVLAFIAILWYPFKRLYKGWKGSKRKSAKQPPDNVNSTSINR